MSQPLWEVARGRDLKELDDRTSSKEGKAEINTSKDSVRYYIHAVVIQYVVSSLSLAPPLLHSPPLHHTLFSTTLEIFYFIDFYNVKAPTSV